MGRHPYHLVDESPWPLVSSFGGLFITTGILSWFHTNDIRLFSVAFLILGLTMFQWWRDISREGRVQPPVGIVPFNPFQVPLLNTIVLLSSGVSVTWAHHALIENNFTQTTHGLALTIILGVYFTCLQAIEYIEASFTFADSVYGSTFYLATGFHGLHVLVGTLFLIVCYVRHLRCEFRVTHHFGFEAAAWYWHFVDVV